MTPLAVPLIQGASSVLSGMMGGPDTPNFFTGGDTISDNSGWTVATGRASATGVPQANEYGWIIPLAIALVAVAWIKR